VTGSVMLRIDEGARIDEGMLRAVINAAVARAGWRLTDGRADASPDSGALDAEIRVVDGSSACRGGAHPVLVVQLDPAAPSVPGEVRGHGLDTLSFPIEAWLRGLESPGVMTAYGDDPDQCIDWRHPAGSAPRGVAVLVHGGFYRSRWRADLMTAQSVDLAERGWIAANLEYRRPDAHGWEATVADVRAGVESVRAQRPGLPLVLIGHSAGGQLVLQCAEAIEPAPDLAVSLAGVVDLRAAEARAMGEHAVPLALGGGSADFPERYDSASPAEFRARRANWLLVQGVDDSADLVEMNRRLSRRADLREPELLEGAGGHFAVIDPDAPLWHATFARIEGLLRV